jgi:hypothetical protein
MKNPSRSMAQSLRTQRVGGRGPEVIETGRVDKRAVGMVATGMGGVVPSPAGPNSRAARSAANAAEPMRRYGGK